MMLPGRASDGELCVFAEGHNGKMSACPRCPGKPLAASPPPRRCVPHLPGHWGVRADRPEVPLPLPQTYEFLTVRLRDDRQDVCCVPPFQFTSVCRQSISDSWLGSLRECLAHLV